MALTPVPLDPLTVISNQDQPYNVRLLTAAPTPDANGNVSSFVEVSDTMYSPQTTTGQQDSVGSTYAGNNLDPVVFNTSLFTTTTPIVGYLVSAVFDDGEAPMAYELFPNPINPQSVNTLYINPYLESYGPGPMYVQW